MIVSISARVHLKHSNPALPQQYGDVCRRAFWEIEAGVHRGSCDGALEPIPAVTGGEAGHTLSLSLFYHRADIWRQRTHTHTGSTLTFIDFLFSSIIIFFILFFINIIIIIII